MAYPIKASTIIPPPDPGPPSAATLIVPFRPAMAGLVNLIVTGVGIIPPPPPPHGGETDPPPPPVLSLRVELLKPVSATPALDKSATQHLSARPIVNRVILFGDVPATATDLAADWAVRVTNFGNVGANCHVTVRYQVNEGNLGKIDHIVVLMMENRSFDHMLGYLSLEKNRSDVDGLQRGDYNLDKDGKQYAIFPFAKDDTLFKADPGHGAPDADEQLSGDAPHPVPPPVLSSNAGFVRNFAKQLARTSTVSPQHDSAEIAASNQRTIPFRPLAPGLVGVRTEVRSRPTRAESGFLGQLTVRRPGNTAPVVPPVKALIGATFISMNFTVTAADLAIAGDWTCEVANMSDVATTFTTDIANSIGAVNPNQTEPIGAIMGYHNDVNVPVYDLLAAQFAICDRWHASLATDTWPNRLYAMTGGSGRLTTTPSGDEVAANPPGFALKTIFEVLQEHAVDWMIYFSDLPFALIFKNLAQDATFTARMRPLNEFLGRVEVGDLPSVSWLEPNFSDVPDDNALASDDHPPYGDIRRGQHLVETIYNALIRSPAWSKTLLLITYDEHGGFYDHVLPPGTPPNTDGPPDDYSELQRYGLRVPAFVVSPWVAAGAVSKTTYDHTSLLRTILLRFCTEGEITTEGSTGSVGGVGGAGGLGPRVPSMGARADHAKDVGPLLSESTPRLQFPTAPTVTPPGDAPRAAFIASSFGGILRRALLGF